MQKHVKEIFVVQLLSFFFLLIILSPNYHFDSNNNIEGEK
ncbi:hypothetical protein EV695_0783 [Cocleimonas flava]|uniref:Uncharacterized protein n=1 Tax=Cocleimonas flava TaxID=634765 RepID=A0A4R1F4Z4_9GAMM|nr:hypothetical protein EV695_0783 [Cocleimonas flava]